MIIFNLYGISYSLVQIAVQNGHADILAELAKHGVDLNQVDINGGTLAYIAAEKGHAAVIAELAKHHKEAINNALSNGATPAFIAAQNGHANVIAELAKHKVNLNQTISNGITLTFVAAQKGHANVIAELAKHGVDLNRPISNGVTPAFIAAQQGHASVIAELIKVGVNFNTPYTASVDSLRQLTVSSEATVIERMNHFIAQQLALSPKPQMISITPYQIAVVMGHTDIVQLLQIKGFSKDGVNISNWEGNRFFNSVSKELSADSSQPIISL